MAADTRRWEIVTERERERNRVGLGQATLDAAIRHLADRGDLTCTYEIDLGPWTDVDLTALPPRVPVPPA